MPRIVRGVTLDQMHLDMLLRKIVNNKSNVRIVAPHTPTHINASSRLGARDSIIDLEVLKNVPFNHDIRVIDDLESDHLPVILTLYTGSALIRIRINSPPLGELQISFK
ncbi:hypothetical protein TNCV_2648791 [Trichonephila clavipes]|nr:hypothetical protein TNCV_2648791 [Trichonephila clavipes]